MLRKRNASAAAPAADETDEHANGLSYAGDADGDEVAEGEYDADAYEEDGEYDEAEGEYSEDEYDEDAEYEDETYDEDAEYYDEDEEYDEEGADTEQAEQEAFTPPTAASALRRSWLSPRPRAQPAAGTPEDAKKVNFLDRRETWIGWFLGAMLVVLAITSYFVDRHYIDKKDLKLQNQIHHEAPWILVITLVLAVFILAATYFKRRAAVGFTLLLAGVALFNSDFLIGIIYLGTGLWLVFRSMRRNPKLQPATAGGRAGAGATRAGTRAAPRSAFGRRQDPAPATSSSSAAANPPRVSSEATRTASSGSGPRQIGRNRRISSPAGQPTGRYTKPKAARYVPPKVQPEPEPTNRLSAWLKK